jgi:hypothetical protein
VVVQAAFHMDQVEEVALAVAVAQIAAEQEYLEED